MPTLNELKQRRQAAATTTENPDAVPTEADAQAESAVEKPVTLTEGAMKSSSAMPVAAEGNAFVTESDAFGEGKLESPAERAWNATLDIWIANPDSVEAAQAYVRAAMVTEQPGVDPSTTVWPECVEREFGAPQPVDRPRVGAAETRLETPTTPKRCGWCWGTNYWTNYDGEQVCWRCHRPALAVARAAAGIWD